LIEERTTNSRRLKNDRSLRIKKTKNGWRSHRRLIQFAKYMLGGSVWFWSGYAIFAICYSGFHWQWWQAKILADIGGWTLNFLVQRYWAFADPLLVGQDRAVRLRYLLITALNFAIDYAIVGSLKHFGVTPYLGIFVSSIFFTGWSYVWYRFWVFKPSS
jgi:putative flippase GtrA